MIILVEKKQTVEESTWRKIAPGKEILVFNSAVSDLEKFIKKYSQIFGINEISDKLNEVKKRMASVTVVNLIVNSTKAHFRGTRPSRDDVVDWIVNTTDTYKKGLFIRYPDIDYAWVFVEVMDAVGL
jgi:hypothetical protein